MRRLTLAILTLWLLTTPAQALECRALSSQGLSTKQVETLHRSFIAGAKDGLSYSLAAVAWQESSAGVQLENPNDPSSGVFHVTVGNALHYSGWEDTEANRQVMYGVLKHDFDTSAEYATLNLKFWIRLHGEDWMKVWASYNAGYNVSAGAGYSRDIAEKVKVIGKCGW